MLLSRHGFLIQEASFHVTSDRSQLVACKPINDDASVQTADGTSCHINHQGCLSSSNFSVPNVSFVPQLSMNLLSVGQVTDYNCFVRLDEHYVLFRTVHLLPPLLLCHPLLCHPHHPLQSGIIDLVIYVALACLH